MENQLPDFIFFENILAFYFRKMHQIFIYVFLLTVNKTRPKETHLRLHLYGFVYLGCAIKEARHQNPRALFRGNVIKYVS